MALTKHIILNSDSHALVRFTTDSGGANIDVDMDEIGGTNGTSVVAIECIEYSIYQSDKELLVQFSDQGVAHETIYELYGQGKIGDPDRRISEDMDAAGGQVSVRLLFNTGALGSALILLRKVSGF